MKVHRFCVKPGLISAFRTLTVKRFLCPESFPVSEGSGSSTGLRAVNPAAGRACRSSAPVAAICITALIGLCPTMDHLPSMSAVMTPASAVAFWPRRCPGGRAPSGSTGSRSRVEAAHGAEAEHRAQHAHQRGDRQGAVLSANHNLLPLLAQLQQRDAAAFEVSYLEEGPEVRKLKFVRN